MRPRRARGRDDGTTLIEIIIAVGLLGAATITVLGAYGTLIKASDLGRRGVDASALLTAVADSAVDNVRNPYQADCAPLGYDVTEGVALPPGFGAAVTGVQYWDGAAGPSGRGAFGATCHDIARATWRLQLITVTVTSTDGRVTRSLNVVKRG